MMLSVGTWGGAGPLCFPLLDLQVAKQGPDARVVTVGREVDTLSAPGIGGFREDQLVAVRFVVLNLNSWIRRAGRSK